MKFCPNCGTKLNDNGICPGCKFDSRQPTFKMEDVLSKATQKINELAGESGSVKLNIRDYFPRFFASILLKNPKKSLSVEPKKQPQMKKT